MARISLLLLACLAISLPSGTARADIIGALELPDGFASGISNVQGWVFTNTPGAELVSPFTVRINGVEQFKVPCCGDRGDVQASVPGAPLLTGFSGVYNWGLIATAAADATATPGAVEPPSELLVEVVVTDTMGGGEVLSKTVDLFHPTAWPRSKLAQWREFGPELPVDLVQGAVTLPPDAECTLTNAGVYTSDAAELECTNLTFTAADDTTSECPEIYFGWDRGSQSFRLTSGCLGPAMPK